MSPSDIMIADRPRVGSSAHEKDRAATLLLLGAAIVGTVAAIVFQLFPQIDMRTAAFFYEGNGVFAGKGGGIYYGASSTIADVVRLTLYIFFVAFCTLAACGLGMSVLRRRPSLGLAAPKWLFLATCLAIGPGVVSNAILKDNWGRARPVHLVEFGGTKTFTPPLVPSKQCHRNCSFVAGEASMAYAAFFAAAFLFTGISGRLILAGVLGGLFSGLVRMSQGAHFLSDVIFAGVVMAATVAGIYLLFDWISRTGGTGPKTGPPNFLSRWCSW